MLSEKLNPDKLNGVFVKIFGEQKAGEINSVLEDISPLLRRLAIDFPFSTFYAKSDQCHESFQRNHS